MIKKKGHLSNITGHTRLVFTLAKVSFLNRNERSYIGTFWYLLGPLLSFTILYIVFSGRLGGNVENYSAYLLSGIVIWNFFGVASSRALTAIISQGTMIKSLPMRRDVIVLSVVLDVFFSHVFELVIFFIFAYFLGVLYVTAFLLPAMLFLNFIFVLGISYALAAIQCVFADLAQIWSVIMRAWWFATPIFYTLNPGGPGEKVNLFNPMYHSIELSRSILIYGKLPSATNLVIFSCFTIVSFAIGYFIFSRLSPRLAEYI